VRKPCQNGKERRIRSVSRCMWCATTATFLTVRVYSVWKGERGEIEGLVPIILRAIVCLYVGFL